MSPKPKAADIIYSTLEDEHKRQILQERINRLEQEHYNHTINLTLAKTPHANLDEEQAKTGAEQAQKNLAIIEHALATLNAELATLPAAE